jgi:hypothetical protein
MTEEQFNTILSLLRGIYRRIGEVRALRQPPLPGLAPDDTRNDAPDGCEWTLPAPGEIARSLPRKWCNTVKVYEALWEKFNDWEDSVPMSEVFKEDTLAAIAKKTSRPIQPQTVARMMTALRRAGAIRRDAHNRHNWFIFLPTDLLREAVEREANRMNAHKAKEVPA